MRIIHDLTQANLDSRSYVTIGVFDGVHRGHRQLIGGMAEAAHAAGKSAVVVAFDPHPAAALGRTPPPLLTTMEERAKLLAPLGLDLLAALPFTPETARTPATDYVTTLIHHLRLAELWGGPDFAFGYRCEGDVPFLRRLGAERGFSVHIVAPLVWDGKPVSSSRVRAALQAGDIPQATGCLGRPYRLSGAIVPAGGEVGGEGVSSVGLSLPPGRLVPAAGVYACRAHTGQRRVHPAVIEIGGGELVVSLRLPGLMGGSYGQTLVLDFVARLGENGEQAREALSKGADWKELE